MARKARARKAWIVNAHGFITGHKDTYGEAVSATPDGGFATWRATRTEATRDAYRFRASGGQLTPDRIAAGWRPVRLATGEIVYGEVRRSRSFPVRLEARAVITARRTYWRHEVAEVLPLDHDNRRI